MVYLSTPLNVWHWSCTMKFFFILILLSVPAAQWLLAEYYSTEIWLHLAMLSRFVFTWEFVSVTFVTDAIAVWWMNLAIHTRQDLGSWKGVDCLSARPFLQLAANLHPIHRQFFVLTSTVWDRHTVLAQSKISCMKLWSPDQFKVQHSTWKYA